MIIWPKSSLIIQLFEMLFEFKKANWNVTLCLNVYKMFRLGSMIFKVLTVQSNKEYLSLPLKAVNIFSMSLWRKNYSHTKKIFFLGFQSVLALELVFDNLEIFYRVKSLQQKLWLKNSFSYLFISPLLV